MRKRTLFLLEKLYSLKGSAMEILQPPFLLFFAVCLSLALPPGARSLQQTSRVSLVQETTANATGEPVLTAAYMRKADAHYFVTGYTVTNVSGATHSRSQQTFGRPFVAKHLLISTATGRAIFVAGYSEENGSHGRPVYRLFLAKISSGWGGPKLGKVVMGDPVALLKVKKLATEGKFVFLCGQSVALGNSTLSGSMALLYDTSLNLKWKAQDEQGSGSDFCADVSIAGTGSRAYQASTKFDFQTGQLEAHGLVNCFDAETGRKIWSSLLTGESIAQVSQFVQSLAKNKHDSSNATIETNVALEKMIAHDGSLFVVARMSSRESHLKRNNIILKLSRASGLMLWAQNALLHRTQQSMEYIRATGITAGSDNYVYTVKRYRSASSYVSLASRISTFKDFSSEQDVSLPLWRSSSHKSAPVGIFYSNMRGAILAFGQSMLISNTTERNTTYVELPIGPATNKAPESLCFGCFGPQFLSICIELVSANMALVSIQAAREVIVELFRLFPYQMNPQTGTNKTRGAEESQEFCYRLQGDDIATIEKNLRKKILLFITERDSEGRNAIERRFSAPPKSIFIRGGKIKIRTKARVEEKHKGEERTAAEVADDFMRNLTIAGVAAACIAIVVVVILVAYGELREALSEHRKGAVPLNTNEGGNDQDQIH